MTLIQMVNQGEVLSLVFMGVIIAGIIAMICFLNNELKKVHEEKKNDQPVVSNIQANGNSAGISAVTAAISAAVNEYRKK